MDITHFIVEIEEARARIVAMAESKAFAQRGIAQLDPAGRRLLVVVELSEWLGTETLAEPKLRKTRVDTLMDMAQILRNRRGGSYQLAAVRLMSEAQAIESREVL